MKRLKVSTLYSNLGALYVYHNEANVTLQAILAYNRTSYMWITSIGGKDTSIMTSDEISLYLLLIGDN